MNKWGCFFILVAIFLVLVYSGIITTKMLLEWSEIALTWLIDALTSLRGYLRTL